MEFKEFAQRPDAYAKLCSMIGPSIYGHSDVKKAIACLLFGGSKKVRILINPLICFQKKKCYPICPNGLHAAVRPTLTAEAT